MKRSNGYLLGIDNGGTATKAALYDIAGKLIGTIRTGADRGIAQNL